MDFAVADRASAYDFIGRTFVQFDYSALDKADKGAVNAYLAKLTGLSRAQLTRLMAQHRETRRIRRPSRRRSGTALRAALHGGGTCACSPRWTPRSLSGAHRPPERCCAASTRSSAMSASCVWRECRTDTCTTCASRAPTGAGAPCSPRPEPEPWPLASDASPAPTGSPGSCAWIPSTRATSTG